MKKVILAVAMGVLSISFVQAQSMKNTLKVGVLGGVAVPNENAGGNAGVDVAYQNLITPHVGIGIATGYNQFFGKDNKVGGVTLNNNNFGVVPVAALIHYYPQAKGIYVGTDLGYGFITGDEKVATNSSVDRPNGGFYLKPEIGWHNRNWNVFAQYTKVFTGDDGKINVGNSSQKYNAGSIGIGVAYNIGLGR